jgi:chorismate--pyruvate lyase
MFENLAARLPQWRSWRLLPRRQLPRGLWDWLVEMESMTERLRQQVGETLTVQVHYQGWQRPRWDDRQCLLVPNIPLMVREVTLHGHDKPWIVARSLFPKNALRGKGQRLYQLGAQPLGEILFADRQLKRGELEVALLRPWHSDYQRVREVLAEPPPTLWARRCVLFFYSQPILVSEIFLPAVWENTAISTITSIQINTLSPTRGGKL